MKTLLLPASLLALALAAHAAHAQSAAPVAIGSLGTPSVSAAPPLSVAPPAPSPVAPDGLPGADPTRGVAEPPLTPAPASAGAVEVRGGNPYPYAPSADAADCAACRANLEKIRAAILAYRRDHKEIPNWLSDLCPQYLPDLAVFTCPVTVKTGRLSPYGPLDPKIRCSYLYEFAPAPMWAPLKMSIRDWKRQQMSTLGSDVPIVRCLLHEPAQNLSFGGRIYESGLIWEDSFLDLVTHDQLQPHEAAVDLTQPVAIQLGAP